MVGKAVIAAGLVGAAAMVVASGGRREPDAMVVDLERRFSQDVSPLMKSYCVSCHSGDDPSGDVSLERLGAQSGLKGEFDLRLIREMMSTGEMPPKRKKDVPRPSEHERLIVTQWLDAMLAYVPADAAVDPGWFTIHRLNRTEYRNTLRDLLGIDPKVTDLSAKLPADDTGYGFDNIADVLSVSPLAIEQYLAAAEGAIELSLGPVVEFGDHPRVLRPLAGKQGQPLPRGGFYLYSNAAASAKFTAPIKGEYIVRVQAWETPAGDERAHLSVRVKGKSVGEFDVTGTRGDPQDFEVRVRLERGESTIAAHFTNDFYVPKEADRNLGIESISVAGPLSEETSERPEVWIRVLGASKGEDTEEDQAAVVLRAFAGRAYRRPASDEQIVALMRVYRAERGAGRSFEPAVRSALVAVLVSPNFLFRTVAHPSAADPASSYTLNGYELASRLSYFLWSSMPVEALLGAAADGSLMTDTGLSAQVARMLADERSRAFVENFSGQWLQLRALERIAIDVSKFPEYDAALREDMLREATLYFGDVLASDRSVLDFVDGPDTFLNERLAKFYGVGDVTGDSFRKVLLPEGSARGGVLTMGAVLTLTSNTTRTSPVKRGLFVLDQMLGMPPPPPPPDIPPLEQAKGGHEGVEMSVREQLAAHTSVPSCAACHNRLDPLGLTFENFDAIGKWRQEENGRPIDASGTLPGGIQLNGVRDLKKTIMDRSDQFVEALSGKVLMYALGRGIEPFDRPAIRKIAARTRANGDRLTAMVESVVLSETFRTCRGRKP
jgi:hypothetical protein